MELSQTKIKVIASELEQLIRITPVDAERIEDFYVFSYRHLVADNAPSVKAGKWSIQEAVCRLTTVYGWMPCSPKSHNEAAIRELVDLLNANADLKCIMPVAARCLSNSLVVAAKFMHRERPEEAPMFDSTLEAKYWSETQSRLSYLPTAVRRYLEWTAAIHAVSPELKAKARAWARATFNYWVTEVRAIEAMAFYAAGNTIHPSSPPFSRAP